MALWFDSQTHSRVQMERAWMRFAQILRSVCCSALLKRGTKSFWRGRALVIHRKYLLSLPAASSLTLLLCLISRVRFVGGNLIALKQFSKDDSERRFKTFNYCVKRFSEMGSADAECHSNGGQGYCPPARHPPPSDIHARRCTNT